MLFSSLSMIFSSYAWILFHRLEQRLSYDNIAFLDHQFTSLQTRLSILAIALLAIDIYALNITDFFSDIPPFRYMPTLQALVCIGVFIGYLSVIWSFSYTAYQQLYDKHLSKKHYVLSNISFAVPVLLPWVVLSGLADLLQALPFKYAKIVFSTLEGQIVYFLFFLVVISIIGPSIIQRFWQCKPLPEGFVRQRIALICQKANLKYNNILDWPLFGGRMMTAGVMGLIGRFRYILVTNSLLSALSFEELDAVIAHEIGHVKKKHLLFYLIFFAGYLVLAYAAFGIMQYLMISSKTIYNFITAAGYQQYSVASFIYTLTLIAFFIAYFRFIFGFFMRNFERQADTYVFSLFETALPLISTFKKISYASSQPDDKPNWHHFSIRERIRFLEECEANRVAIYKHDRKVRRSISLFMVGLLFSAVVGYQLNVGTAGQKLTKHIIKERLEQELTKAPNDPYLLSKLGDIYLLDQNWEKTINAYERSLSFKNDAPHVLNNLAWLYATCEDETFRRPVRALQLARYAAALASSPEILDTLAECYFVNGDFMSAVRTEKAALAVAKKNRSYYESQLNKFMAAYEGSS